MKSGVPQVYILWGYTIQHLNASSSKYNGKQQNIFHSYADNMYIYISISPADYDPVQMLDAWNKSMTGEFSSVKQKVRLKYLFLEPR